MGVRGGQQTARPAATLLAAAGDGFVIPTLKQRDAILVAFVRKGFVVYGRAFGAVKCTQPVALDDADDIQKNIHHIVLYEVRSTIKLSVRHGFRGYFFSLSTAELLAAQNLGDRFRFIFVNTLTHETMELTLPELFSRAKAIYPSWSVAF